VAVVDWPATTAQLVGSLAGYFNFQSIFLLSLIKLCPLAGYFNFLSIFLVTYLLQIATFEWEGLFCSQVHMHPLFEMHF
jgi:hypothetical protein